MRQVALVIETTGLDAAARIVEIGAVEMIDGQKTGNVFNAVINPHHAITAGAENLHHLGNLNIERFADFAAVADKFLSYIKDAEVIIHFPFVREVLNRELNNAGKPMLHNACNHIVDTWVCDKKLNTEGGHSLDAIAIRYGLLNAKRTDRQATRDAGLLADVHNYIVKDAEDRGIELGKKKEVKFSVVHAMFPAATVNRRYDLRPQVPAVNRFKPY